MIGSGSVLLGPANYRPISGSVGSVTVILSIHVPKTAGMSFGGILKAEYGNRLLLDYGDYQNWVEPQRRPAILRRVQEEARLRRDELLENYQVIHGHFFPEKVHWLIP